MKTITNNRAKLVSAAMCLGFWGLTVSGAQAQGASYTNHIHPGLNLIANQLDHGSNTVAEIFANVPDHCVVFKYDNAGSNWTSAVYHGGSHRWVPENVTINPGEGAFFQSPSSFNLVFTGNPHVPVLPITIQPGAIQLLSRQTNGLGNYANISGGSPVDGTRIFRWTGSIYSVATYSAGVWSSGGVSGPTAAIGEALWVAAPGGPTPPAISLAPMIVGWPRTQVVPVGSNATFLVSVAGQPPFSYQWFKNGDPMNSATGAVLTLSPVNFSNAGYYHLTVSNAFGMVTSPSTLLRTYDPQGSSGVSTDYGDLPAKSWSCCQYSWFNDDCGVETKQYTAESDPPVIYPTTSAQNGARHSWTSGNLDETWLGSDVTPTDDGVPNSNAKGDPGNPQSAQFNNSDNDGKDFTAAAVLHEEDGLRMIPSPFDNNGNEIAETLLRDPRMTVRGKQGNNLFGAGGSITLASEGTPARVCYTPGQTIWFTVEAHNEDVDAYENGVSYLNVWIDYGDDSGTAGAPDGRFQPGEYAIVDQPLWSSYLLQTLAADSDYPYDTGTGNSPTPAVGWVHDDLSMDGSQLLPTIGKQPFAKMGLQVVSVTLPTALGDLTCGKKAFARFRLSRRPLNLFRVYEHEDGSEQAHLNCTWPVANPTAARMNTYSLKNAAGHTADGYPDPSLGEVTGGGEVEDFPITFNGACPSVLGSGPSTLCLTAASTMSSVSGNAFGNGGVELFSPVDTLLNPINSTAGQIEVSGSFGGMTAGFDINVSDNAGNNEIMHVRQVWAGSQDTYLWDVDRDSRQCSGASSFDAGATITLAAHCQCARNQGVKLPFGLLRVTGYNPGSPCPANSHLFYDLVAPEHHPFVVEVANTGGADMTGVRLSWPVPTNAVFYGASASQGNWTMVNGAVTFELGALEAGQTASVGISFHPKATGFIYHNFNLAADQPLLGQSNFQIANFVAIKPVLAIERATNNTARISWPTNDVWTLQQSSGMGSGWTTAPSQISPYTVVADQPMQLFRLAK